MTALLKERTVREERWTYHLFNLATGKKALKGGIAVYDESAAAVIPGEEQTDLFPIGLFAETVDNTAGTAPVSVNVQMFREVVVRWFANGGATPATVNDIGKTCFVLDDQTVTMDGTGHSAFGTVWAVDTVRGVAVEVK